VKELLEGRRFGFAPRPMLGQLALGVGVGVTLLDLMAWFGWGARDTNGFVIGAYWLAIAAAVFAILATVASLAESTDVAEEDRPLARLDLLAAFAAFAIYAISAFLRSRDLGGAGATPVELLSAIAGLIVLAVDGVIASTLYASREWAVLDEEEVEPRRRSKRRRAS
jgi:uncharacterized membrane protein